MQLTYRFPTLSHCHPPDSGTADKVSTMSLCQWIHSFIHSAEGITWWEVTMLVVIGDAATGNPGSGQPTSSISSRCPAVASAMAALTLAENLCWLKVLKQDLATAAVGRVSFGLALQEILSSADLCRMIKISRIVGGEQASEKDTKKRSSYRLLMVLPS
jgi:hypothetical protein